MDVPRVVHLPRISLLATSTGSAGSQFPFDSIAILHIHSDDWTQMRGADAVVFQLVC